MENLTISDNKEVMIVQQQLQDPIVVDLPTTTSTNETNDKNEKPPTECVTEEKKVDYSAIMSRIREIILAVMRHNDWIGEAPNYSAILSRILAADSSNSFIPDIRVLPGRVIRALGRVAKYDEINPDTRMPYHVSLREVIKYWKPHGNFKRPIVNVLSTISDLDTLPEVEAEDIEELVMLNESKAPTMAALSNYSMLCYQHDVFWITSYGCFEEGLVRSGIVIKALMPLLIGLCDGLVSLYDGEEYDKDPWTALQRLVYATFKSPIGWKFIPFHLHLSEKDSEHWTIPDPRILAANDVNMTEDDRQFIHAMTELCIELWPTAYAMNWKAKDNVYSKWKCPKELTPGETAVFTWTMNHYCFTKRKRQPKEDKSKSSLDENRDDAQDDAESNGKRQKQENEEN